jgi:2-succinyl-5-enolpyruvyl-6-hydroxy-3-cyclohexene-1-carboxylate synthase
VNPSTALATVLVDELVRQGVRHAVLCPGSRSAPLAYALQSAERAGLITLHVRVDERSAGFLALGLAKLTRTPAAVVTTSGTAVANLHPAVLEAHHGGVPLIVLSADRPVELRGTGANQTTVQPGMFAAAVRWSCDVPAPERETGQVVRWRDVAEAAFQHATGAADPDAEPGPEHLNVQLREPLVPTDDDPWVEALDTAGLPGGDRDGPAPEPRGAAAHASAVSRAAQVGTAEAVAVTTVEDVPRTLVLIGDLPEPDQFERAIGWARSRGWPVLAEPFGTHPRSGVVAHGPLVLSEPGWLDEHAPDRVVTVGRLTLSRPVAGLLRRPGVRVEAVGTHAWIESRPDVHAVHPVSVLDEPIRHRGGDVRTDDDGGAAWLAAWREAGSRVQRAVADVDLPWPSGLAVADVVVSSLPADSTLFLGSSNAARDVDLANPRGGALRVVASRGLAGIDGCLSTAVGLALAGHSPTYALMGDLTFLHDTNGLLIGPLERQPDLTVVVTNDDGGGIFTLLEPGEPSRAADFERLFGTPTGTDLAALCGAHGVRHQRISSAEQLGDALGVRPSGLTVLEVPVDRGSHRRLHAQLREHAAAALQPDQEAPGPSGANRR